MSKEANKSPAKGQSKAPAITSDKHPVFPPIKTKSLRIYSPHIGGDGCKPNLGSKKK